MPKFSLRTLLYSTALAGLLLVVVCIAIANHFGEQELRRPKILPANFKIERHSFRSDDRTTHVATGIADNQIVYIEIFSESGSIELAGSSSTLIKYSDGTQSVAIYPPNGKPIFPPADIVIFQNRDGVWTESTKMITLNAWRRFLATEPTDCSIDLLVAFNHQSNAR